MKNSCQWAVGIVSVFFELVTTITLRTMRIWFGNATAEKTGVSCFSFSSERGFKAVSWKALIAECAFGRGSTQKPHSYYPPFRLDPLLSLSPYPHNSHPSHPDPLSMQYPNLINGSTSAQQKLAGGQLDDSCNLALNNEALIGPCDLEIVKERFLWCVLHPKQRI